MHFNKRPFVLVSKPDAGPRKRERREEGGGSAGAEEGQEGAPAPE